MSLIFGQFFNQTLGVWQWQQIGGTATSAQDAEGFAYGFARDYGIMTKVITRGEVKIYLPPKNDDQLVWPEIQASLIVRTSTMQ
jgi:hypothetical protein